MEGGRWSEGGEDLRTMEGTKVGRIRGRGGNEGGEDLKVGVRVEGE